MQYLDDDMSELFRKASEDIRLRPENDGWNKIQKKLLPDISTLPDGTTSTAITAFYKRNNYRLWVYAFIILAISGASGILLINGTASRIDINHIHESNLVIKSERKSAIKNSPVVLREKSNGLPTFSEPFKAKELNVLSDADQINAKPKAFSSGEQLGKIGAPLKLDLFKNVESIKNQSGVSKGKRFYIGIIAGPQFCQTKQQGFSNAGLSVGILLGFHLNNRLSVESGFILSNKYYASAGENFDMGKLSATMPTGMKLIQVQSKTNVMEIPINMKYDVLKLKKGDLFVSSGISSYILTNEKNLYQASLNGNNKTLSGKYPEHRNYYAAAINISAGYEYKAGKNVSLRIEPYLQIPLKTIGMGSMHVVSIGVYLGITIPVIK